MCITVPVQPFGQRICVGGVILTLVPARGFFLHAQQFSDKSWVFYSSTPFGHGPLGADLRSHKMSAQSRSTAPTSDASPKSRLLPLTDVL